MATISKDLKIHMLEWLREQRDHRTDKLNEPRQAAETLEQTTLRDLRDLSLQREVTIIDAISGALP